MAVALTRLSNWLWGGKNRETPNSSLNSTSDGFREPESLKFPPAIISKISSRRIRRKCPSLEERRIDKEYDLVIVPSDGVCMSESDSDESDWSIGWLEPHSPEFQSDTEENNFAVLVPCYGRSPSGQVQSPKNRPLSALDFVNNDLPDGKKFLEEWLSSL